MDDKVIGFLFIILGAICGGSFGLPSKFVKKDTPWETLWGPFFFFATILIPMALGPAIVNKFFQTCSAAEWAMLAGPVIFGFLWGLGSMTLGLSFAFIGLSLAYAINYAAQIMFGSMGPILIHSPDQVMTKHGGIIMLGVAICLGGVVVVGRAGVLKTRSMENAEGGSGKDGQSFIMKGMGLAFLSGILCACYAVAFSFGDKVTDLAKTEFGTEDPFQLTFIVTALILWGGAMSSCFYCAYKLSVNKTWGTLTGPGIGRVLGIAIIMAALHDGAILLWGLGVGRLGALGIPVGYPIFMSLAIIVGNINGFLTKEWKGASRKSVQWIVGGILVLVLGVFVLAKGLDMKGAHDKENAPPVKVEVENT